jgi:hypothetical protein
MAWQIEGEVTKETEILTVDDVINEIADVLREADGEYIESVANQILTREVTYTEDSLFERPIEG